jgi:extracellular elastinolytic metalloproteinase
VLGAALVAPAAARAAKPNFDIRTPATPQLTGTRPLTAPAPAGARVPQALAYVRAHAGALGLTAARVDALGAPERRAAAGGVVQLRWPRSFGGIPAFDDQLRVALGADGAVLNATGSTDTAPPSLEPVLGPVRAMRVVRDDAGATGEPVVTAGPNGPRRDTAFAAGGRAQLVVFGSRLAWQVDYRALSLAFYDTVVDATTGAILRRVNLVKTDGPADVWDDHPNGTAPRRVMLSTTANTLENTFAHAWTDTDGNHTAQAGEEVQPVVRALDTTFAGPGCALATPCTWNPLVANGWAANEAQDAIQAYYLVSVYRQHLAADIGFNQFSGAEKLRVEVDAGVASGQTNNSSMTTPPPGNAPTMSLYLFDGTDGFRAMSGAEDASIVFHEYTHGFTNRTVVDGQGVQALNTAQAWGIDEASADFYAKSFLVDKGWEADAPASGDVDMGDYTDTTPHSIRYEPIDCPVSAPRAEPCPKGGLTYADFGKVGPRPEPHADGEIWSETLWDLRAALGSAKTIGIASAALGSSPDEPSYLQMRDGILQADPADAPTIWSVFRRRGMGVGATTNGSADTRPHADFTMPPGIPDPDPSPVETPTPEPAPIPTVSPQPTASPTPSATPKPTVTAPTRPRFTIPRTGKRVAAFMVRCYAACTVSGTLTIDKKTARKLHLGSTRTIGTVKYSLKKAGKKTLTVHLSRKAAKALKRVTSITAKLKTSARYGKAKPVAVTLSVKIKR